MRRMERVMEKRFGEQFTRNHSALGTQPSITNHLFCSPQPAPFALRGPPHPATSLRVSRPCFFSRLPPPTRPSRPTGPRSPPCTVCGDWAGETSVTSGTSGQGERELTRCTVCMLPTRPTQPARPIRPTRLNREPRPRSWPDIVLHVPLVSFAPLAPLAPLVPLVPPAHIIIPLPS